MAHVFYANAEVIKLNLSLFYSFVYCRYMFECRVYKGTYRVDEDKYLINITCVGINYNW